MTPTRLALHGYGCAVNVQMALVVGVNAGAGGPVMVGHGRCAKGAVDVHDGAYHAETRGNLVTISPVRDCTLAGRWSIL